MGVTVEKSPSVKLYDRWFDERTYFGSDKPLLKISDVLNLVYSMLRKHTYKKIDDETIEEYDDKVN
eukprot:12879079-Ditylum_brightwellii.AAC.1